MTKEFLDVHDLAAYLSIKRSTAYAMVERGELPHYKIGRLIRFRRNDVDAWMEKQRREGINLEKKATSALKRVGCRRMDIDRIVKESIEQVKGSRYNQAHGKPDQVKGLGKEVEHGSL